MSLYKNPDFCRLPVGLAAIFDKSSRQSFFELPEWYDILARFGTPPDTEIRVYTDERPGSMLAVPLKVCPLGDRHCLASLANFYSVEHGLIMAPDADLGRGTSAILSEIDGERPRWDCLRLDELAPSETSYDAWFRTMRRAGLLVERGFASATWYEPTAGRSFTDYLAGRSSQLRNTWRRKRKRLAATGRLRRALFSEISGIDGAIADYQTIYAASWKSPEPFPHFIPALIRIAAELGALRLGLYYIDEVPAAAQLWIVWRGRAVIYKLAHDRRFDELSLGTLLTMDMIEHVLERDRPDEINLGRGDNSYKRLWLSKRRERWAITAANPKTIAGLRFGFVREMAKIYHWLRGEPLAPPARSAEG